MRFQASRRPVGISRGDGVQQRSMLDAPLDAATAGRKYRQSVPFDRQSLLTDQTQQAWPGARLVKRLVERAVTVDPARRRLLVLEVVLQMFKAPQAAPRMSRYRQAQGPGFQQDAQIKNFTDIGRRQF